MQASVDVSHFENKDEELFFNKLLEQITIKMVGLRTKSTLKYMYIYMKGNKLIRVRHFSFDPRLDF